MNEVAAGKSIKDDFNALTPKQWIAIIAGLAIAMVLVLFGGGGLCFGIILAPIFLYMIPHLLGVQSVRIKAVMGVVFIVATMLIGTFAFIGVDKDLDISKVGDGKVISDPEFDYEDYALTATIDFAGDYEVIASFAKVTMFRFGMPMHEVIKDEDKVPMVPLDSDRYGAHLDMEDGILYYVLIQVKYMEDGKEKEKASMAFLVNTGANVGIDMYLKGTALGVVAPGAFYFLLVAFSFLMRRSIGKTRQKMEDEGRLYPQGYGRCKECGTLVLPGEVTCRKCGAYIDVPEEMKASKKDYFVCTECGAEVPNDAKECPKCGAKFEGVENEVVHADGTVDVSSESFECSECGAQVPANATHCPKCGAKFDEDDE